MENMEEIIATNEVAEEAAENAIPVDEEIVEDHKNKAIDEEDPTSDESMANIRKIIQNIDQMLQIMKSQWDADVKEFNVTPEHINQLTKWNSDHRTELTEDATDAEKEAYDPLNGIRSITEEAALEIFGKDSNVICFEHSVTVDRIDAIMHDWFSYASAMREYKQIHDTYMELMDLKEEKNMEQLRVAIENTEDPETKAKLQSAYDLYFNRKYLDFMAEPLDEKTIGHIINVLTDDKKTSYVMNRCKDKLKQCKISSKFILEISQFEKRYLEEKYWKCSQCILSYFMNLMAYSNASDKSDPDRTKAVCMVFALDGIIQGTWKDDRKDHVIKNLCAFLDQLIDKVPTKEEESVED